MIFLDVGAHEGQTLEEVVKERYSFRNILAFEPMPEQYAIIKKRYGELENVKVFNYGLADQTGVLSLYGDNTAMDSTLYRAKRDTPHPEIVTQCQFFSAASVVRLLPQEPTIMKLNCEGGEIRIIDNLIDTGEIWKIDDLMIDFDIRKVEGMEHEEQRITRRLAAIGFDSYQLAENVMHGATHQQRIAAWLDTLDGRTW